MPLQRHHQDNSCIKMGSDESRFNVSFLVRDKVTKTVFSVALRPQKQSGLLGTGSPGRPPRLSYSSENQNPGITIFNEERRAKAESNRGPSAYQHNVFTASASRHTLTKSYSVIDYIHPSHFYKYYLSVLNVHRNHKAN